jgi:hypothetical protein
MKITFRPSPAQVKSGTERSYAGTNKIDTSSRADLQVALRRVKNREALNMREVDALMKNGYDIHWQGEEAGLITIDGVNHNFKLHFDSLASNLIK